MFYLMIHSAHFIYGYMASDIKIAKEKSCCRHFVGYSFQLAARNLLYALSHGQNSTYHDFVTPVVEHWQEREIAQLVQIMATWITNV